MSRKSPLNFIATAVATCGVGFAPKAPGTVGSLLAAIMWWFFSAQINYWVILATFFVGWLTTHFYETWNHKHDPKEVVIDEVVGLWITLSMASSGFIVLLFGFLLFRLFDIWKPFPIGWVDRKVPGAFGTMIDDVLAGLAAGVCLLGLSLFMEHYGILV